MARVGRALIAAAAALGVLGAGSGTIAPEPPARPAPLTLRFVTFNLLHGGIFSELSGDDEGLEDRLRLAVDGLRALDADVVGLQEASTGRRRGNVTARLASALGYHYIHAPAATRPFRSEHMRRAVASVLGFTEGPALLSRFPIARWRAYELPRCGRPFDVRVLLFAELETPAGRLAAFSAHTSGDACHARAVVDLVRANAGPLPAVLMGDFNAPASSPAIQVLTREAGFLDAFGLANPATSGYTDGQDVEVARATASERIDYVFLAPGQRVPGRVVRSRVVLHEPSETGRVRWPSDHYGVLAEIALERSAVPHVAGGGPPAASGASEAPGAERRPGL
jgi:endonuclease/exonuclease/phosphatase family metal-dependent hydrolase